MMRKWKCRNAYRYEVNIVDDSNQANDNIENDDHGKKDTAIKIMNLNMIIIIIKKTTKQTKLIKN